MKIPQAWAGALTLAVVVVPVLQLSAATNAVVVISTRYQQDTGFSNEYMSDEKGPGMVTPGDVAMASLLSDNGYSCRLILDRLLGPAGVAAGFPPPETFLQPVNPDLTPSLAIMSGSGASADTPPPPPGMAVMMGEHVCLGNNSGRVGSLYMYGGTSSSDPNESSTPPATKFMKVVDPNHPIMKGIPVDAQGRVKIFREPYPEENAHLPVGGKINFEYRWCTQVVADKAPGTAVLGVLDGAEERSCFAVFEAGGVDAAGNTITNRMVHLFLNENGSGGSRRVFYALTELGRVLFLRAAKWAMGEDLEPYQSFKITDVTMVGAQQLKLTWEGSAQSNYRIVGSTDMAKWRTVVDDIPGGTAGAVSRTLDISAGPKEFFMRVAPLP